MKQIILVLMLFLCCSIEQQAQQFIAGTYLDMEYTQDARVYPLLDSLNINTLMAHTPLNYQTLLQNYKLLAFKEDNAQDAIAYYARGYYKKWEASEDQTNTLATGVKHNGGNQTTINDTSCWTSDSTSTQKINNLIYGPTYRQDKFYRVFFEPPSKIRYIANYYLSVENHPGFNPSPGDTVCKIAVVFKYLKRVGNTSESYFSETLDSAYLKVSDFNGNYFNKKTLSYTYPSYITSVRGKDLMQEMISAQDISYIDDIPETGIEFRVDWLGAKKLNVYGVEVYDDVIWARYISPLTHQEVINRILSSATQYSNWNNIKYWYVHDEPQSLDLYEPYKVIDNILSVNSKPGVITTFYPQWDGRRNGDITLNKFKSLANPQKILMDYYPYWKDTATPAGLELLRKRLQEISLQDTSFWYTAQAFGDTSECNPNVGSWRTPSAEDLKASVMLSLAHGAKGVLYWKFIDFLPANTTCDTFFTTIVDAQFNKQALWYPVKEINNRLKNVLGNTLVNLNYTGNYINVTQDSTLPKTNNFLTIQQNDADYNWHIGFLNDKTYQDNKHFLLVNLRTAAAKTAKLLITNNFGYNNLRIRNIEDQSLDITINTSYTLYQTLQAGEGKLYQVAPVVKYGGTLMVNETVTGSLQMGGNIIVPTGVTLTIAANSVINPNGFSIVSTGGTITIQSGATVNGAILKTGSMVKAIYPTMQAALTAAVSGQTVTVNIPQTVSGSFFIVPSGVTLSFGSNAIITFSPGRRISVYGNLTANGTTFKGNGTRGSWLGISFNSGSTGSIQSSTITDSQNGISFSGGSGSVQSSTITNGLIGIYMNNGTATIQGNTITNNSYSGVSSLNSSNLTVTNCTLSNNGTGITANSITSSINYNSFLNNTNYGINATGISIYDYWYYNAFHGNGYAMVLNNASPWIAHDTICGNNHGVVINSSFPNFCVPGGGGGFNAITYSTTPLFRADNSSAVVMGYWSQGGYNSVFGSELPDMEARNSSHIWADNTYWGSGQPAILADGTSWITTRTPLTYDPVPTICTDYSPQSLMAINSTAIDANVSSINSDKASKYAEAITSGREGHFQKARKSLLTLIDGEFDHKYSPLALLSFYEFTFKERYTKGKRAAIDSLNNELKDILAKVTKRAKEDSLRPFALRFLAREAALSNNTLEMLSYNKEIVANYPNSSNELSALFDLITYYTDVEQDVTKTDEYYARMVKAYPDEDLTKFAAINLGKNKKNLKKGAFTEEELLPTEYSLSNAYPNPFNPITTITYQIPKDGLVTLEVFDILGNKVTTLVNQQKVTGKYSVQFDASSLASGTYVYRLRVNDYVLTKKMLLLK